MPIAAAPVILSAAVVAAVAFLNERDKKKEVAPPPIEPPIVPPPIVPPPPIEPNVNVEPTDFPAGALLGVIGADGVNLRQEPNERSRSLGTLARGTIVELFEGGHEPATTAAPSGWERARTRSGTTGFVAAHLLTGRACRRSRSSRRSNPNARSRRPASRSSLRCRRPRRRRPRRRAGSSTPSASEGSSAGRRARSPTATASAVGRCGRRRSYARSIFAGAAPLRSPARAPRSSLDAIRIVPTSCPRRSCAVGLRRAPSFFGGRPSLAEVLDEPV